MRIYVVVSLVVGVPAVTLAQAGYPDQGTEQVPVIETGGVQESQPPPQRAECIPTCRSGFMCVHGTCVSACNPLCAAGQTCSASGECIADAPVQLAQPVQPIGFQPVRVSPEHEAERQRLRALRARLRLGMFVELGYMLFSVDGDEDGGELDLSVPHFALGFELRKNFAYRVGVRFRAGVDFGVGSEEDFLFDVSYRAWQTRILVNPNLRFGPFAQGFPLYLEIGAHAGLCLRGASPTGTGSMSGMSGDSVFDVQVAFGPELGIGFLAGEERFDIALHANSGWLGNEFQFWSASFSFGFAFN